MGKRASVGKTSVVIGSLVLSACGGGQDAPQVAASRERDAQAARAEVTIKQLPQLHQCLARLSRALRADASQRGTGLDCVAGTYSGLTTQGEACALRVDAGQGRFSFTYAGKNVSIDWDDMAHRAGGPALHNLEPADLGPQQPGVQLTRYTSAPESVTETIALRAGAPLDGPRGLPHMTYLQVRGDHLLQVDCKFGT